MELSFIVIINDYVSFVCVVEFDVVVGINCIIIGWGDI